MIDEMQMLTILATASMCLATFAVLSIGLSPNREFSVRMRFVVLILTAGLVAVSAVFLIRHFLGPVLAVTALNAFLRARGERNGW